MGNNIVDKNEKFLTVNTETNETKIKNVYIGGDALRGPSTVIESIADGKKAAEAIIKEERIQPDRSEIQFKRSNIEDHIKSIEDKRGNILIGNSSKINIEASKCLECNLLCNKCVEVCPNRANVAIRTGLIEDGLKDFYQILHIDGLCNECGNCETFCPYSDAPYKVKTTLFWTEEDFYNSKNDGFYFEGTPNDLNHFKIRYNSKIGNLSLDKNGNFTSSSINDTSLDFQTFRNFIGKIFINYNYLINVNV